MRRSIWISLGLHGVALGLGLFLWTPGPAVPGSGAPHPLVAAFIEAVEPVVEDDEVVEDGLELADQPRYEDDEVLLPAVVRDEPPLVEDDLPEECEPDCVERAPLTLPEVPLDAVRIQARRPRTVPSEAAAPPTPAARPAPKATPTAKRRSTLKLLHRPDVALYYPEAARRRGIEGTAMVRIEVDGRGVVTDARISRSSGSALLDRHALRFARDMRFDAGRGGRAVQPVSFTLE